jgi:hypothetical protein
VGAAEGEHDAAENAEGEGGGDEPLSAVLVRERAGDQEARNQTENVEREEQVDLNGCVAVDLPIHQQQRGEVVPAPGRDGDRGRGSPPRTAG